MMTDKEQIKRWRLILGQSGSTGLEQWSGGYSLSPEELAMDQALAAIYDKTASEAAESGGRRSAGAGPSAPQVAKWLADIRTYFTTDIVAVIQTDAIERKGLKQLLFEPEILKTVQPNLEMVTTLMALKGKIPERTKDTAREIVRTVVEDIQKRLDNQIRRAVSGALNKKKHSPLPSAASIDWKHTIQKNLKHYNSQYRRIIPERVFFFDRSQRQNSWHVILDMDQSGSMADSIIYGSVAGSILASMPAISTRIVAFDTEVVDLSEQYGNDPVDMLFGIQLGGGTDINKSAAYCQQFITHPAKTLFILLTDLYEGGNSAALVRRMEEMQAAGVKAMCLLALSDRGTPSYDDGLARRLAKAGVPCFACTPSLLPELLEGVLKGMDLQALAQRIGSRKQEKQG